MYSLQIFSLHEEGPPRSEPKPRSLLMRALRPEAIDRESLMRQQLREALAGKQFELEYQPIYCLSTRRLVKAEALLRWHCPNVGKLGPDRFLPALEETGLIAPVERWVLETACAQAVRWSEAGLGIKVSVNVSPVQLAAGFTADVARALREQECDSSKLELEITEHSLVRNYAAAKYTVAGLAALGATVAIDDFGSGYSSLCQLAELPVHAIKVDRHLIRRIEKEPRRAAIMDAIACLARSLGLELTVEGVEDAEQARHLARYEGLRVQGYFFGRPMQAALIGDAVRAAR